MSARVEKRPLLEPANRAELRDWLEANHATSAGVQLAIGKKGTTVTALTYDDAAEEGLCFGWIDSVTHRLDADRFIARFTPRRPGGTWARSNKARIERLTAKGLMRPAGLAAIEAAKADGSWDAFGDVEELRVPDDLAAALAEHPDAQRFWDALPPGQRKLALYWVGSAKRPETRARRIAESVTAAAEERRIW
ncbi:MAG: YdeI/OmpD-associated family protein [Actinomycetota bacterium]|nr:YdeI/OmpD-associated family protein [Actinomycetota bacterium]